MIRLIIITLFIFWSAGTVFCQPRDSVLHVTNYITNVKVKKEKIVKLPNPLKQNCLYQIKIELNRCCEQNTFLSIEWGSSSKTRKFNIIYCDSLTLNQTTSEISFNVISKEVIKELNFKTNHSITILNLYIVKLDLKYIDHANLVPNGSFNWFSNIPNKLFNGTHGLYAWQEKLESSCFESRTLNLIQFYKETKVYSEPILGTADFTIDSIDCQRIDDDNYVGRIRCDNYGDIKKDKSQWIGEYLQVKLKEPLVAGMTYEISMIYKLDLSSRICSKNLGIKLTTCPFHPFDKELIENGKYPKSNFNISDNFIENREWAKFNLIFKASGSEEYLTIGMFSDDGNIEFKRTPGKLINEQKGAYYLVDDIKLVLIQI